MISAWWLIPAISFGSMLGFIMASACIIAADEDRKAILRDTYKAEIEAK